MSQPHDIRQAVTTSYACAVEQNPKTGSWCCSGAEIGEGDTVLDLGSGAGIDLLLAAELAGPKGKVIGVDMTPAMIERVTSALAGQVASIRVVGRKPEEVLP